MAAGGGSRAAVSTRQRERREADRWTQSEFKIQIKSKSTPNLIRSKHYHPRLQNFEKNTKRRGLRYGTNFVIGSSSNLIRNLN
jgi:hypothetical protein